MSYRGWRRCRYIGTASDAGCVRGRRGSVRMVTFRMPWRPNSRSHSQKIRRPSVLTPGKYPAPLSQLGTSVLAHALPPRCSQLFYRRATPPRCGFSGAARRCAAAVGGTYLPLPTCLPTRTSATSLRVVPPARRPGSCCSLVSCAPLLTR